MRFDTIGDYARHTFPLHRSFGGDGLRTGGNTVIAHYTEPAKATRVLETAQHEFGHLDVALVRLEVRAAPTTCRPDRVVPTPSLDELFDASTEPPAWLGVVCVIVVVLATLASLRWLAPIIGMVPAVASSLGAASLGSVVGFVIARRIAHLRRWHRHLPQPQPMALAVVRTSGDAAIASVVALMERFEPESVRILGADGWRSAT